MGVWGIVLGSVLIVAAIAIIIVIILRAGQPAGYRCCFPVLLTLISRKNKARSIDAKLARFTKFFAAIFVIIVIALNVLAYFVGKSF